MSDHVEGLVAKISEKAAGKGTVYNVCLEIEGQDDEWFGHGFDEPVFQEGDEIEFDIKYNGDYCNVDPNTVNILSEGEPKPKSRGRSSGGRSGGGGGRNSKPAASRGSSRGSSRLMLLPPVADLPALTTRSSRGESRKSMQNRPRHSRIVLAVQRPSDRLR